VREKTCCFSGHRIIPQWEREQVHVRLQIVIRRLILSGYCYFGAGGALGFDTLAAQMVLQYQREFPHVKLILVLPCISQADRWSERDRHIYERIKMRANKVVYVSTEYTRECMQKRNRHLVDHSSACICYLKKETGGTAYTIKYAKENGLRIENVAQIV